MGPDMQTTALNHGRNETHHHIQGGLQGKNHNTHRRPGSASDSFFLTNSVPIQLCVGFLGKWAAREAVNDNSLQRTFVLEDLNKVHIDVNRSHCFQYTILTSFQL
jgi:hypothetical protein